MRRDKEALADPEVDSYITEKGEIRKFRVWRASFTVEIRYAIQRGLEIGTTAYNYYTRL